MNAQVTKQHKRLEALAGDNLLSLTNWVTENERRIGAIAARAAAPSISTSRVSSNCFPLESAECGVAN